MINFYLTKLKFIKKLIWFIKSHNFIIFFSIIYFFVGVSIFKDYGIGIEEHFQRSSGLYWLGELLQFTNFENLKDITANKILDIKTFTPNLPPPEIANDYGVVFDLPVAFIEVFFNIKGSENFFYLRHFLTFSFFFISAIFFYKILILRTSNALISFFGYLMYLLSPRIFGNSFFDGKDLFFLSILTISFYLYLNYEKKKNYISLILFSLFCALTTSSRIFGLFLPISFIIIIFFEIINKQHVLSNFKFLIIFIFLYLTFLFLHWPFLMTFDYSDFSNIFETFKVHGFYKVFFNGEFYESNYLPLSYLPKWIFISIPEFYIPLFFIGILFYLKRISLRIFNLKATNLNNDLWKGVNDKFELFIFLCLFQVLVIYLTFDINLFKGWTHFIFINFFLTYYAAISIYVFYLKFRFKKKLLIISSIIFSLLSAELIFQLYIFHPYQSIYFNRFVRSNDKSLYENDNQSLSRVDAIKDILADSKQKKIIIATASWTPLEDARYMIASQDRERLVFTGTANKEKADYIFTTNYFEVDTRFNKKYSIPSNFYLFKTLNIDGIKIYSIYKKS